MKKKQSFIIGLMLIGAIILLFILHLLLKKEKDIRAIFEKEVVANLKEGYSVKDTIFESLDGKNQHVIAIIHWEAQNGLDRQDSIIVYELRGEKCAEIFKSVELNFELGNDLKGDCIRAEDINQDNLKEFIVTRSQGGNCWTCASLRVFQVKDHRCIEFFTNLPETQVIYGIIDLNEDGIKELIVLDAEWEVESGLCHACSPSVDIIYTWKKNRYKKASVEFPFYYDERIKELVSKIEESVRDGSLEYYIGRSMSAFFNYLEKGEREKGWEVFENYLAEKTIKENFILDERNEFYKESARQIVRDFYRRYIEQP